MRDEETRLLVIGEFASLTRLAPSALRYYDDAGLLRPAHVDPASAYRRYSRSQVSEALLIRELRALAMPISEVRALLDAAPDGAHRHLDAHWEALQARLAEAGSRLAAAHRLIDRREDEMSTVVTIDASALADAVRQVAPAAPAQRLLRPGSDRPLPGGLLVAVTGNVMRLVGTDGHRLAMRDLVPSAIEGGGVSRIVPTAALEALVTGLPASGAHELRIEDLPEEPGPYPEYQAVLDRLTGGHRLVATVAELRHRVEAAGPVVLLDGFEPPLTAAFDRAYLLAALDAAPGPDAIVETEGPLAPALIRSAVDGSFTAVVMPIRLDEAQEPATA